MEIIQDPLKHYQEIFKSFITKINKILDKKQKLQFQNLIESHKTEVFSETSKIGLSANKHFILFYKLMQLRNIKISSECLYHIEKLVQHKFLNGNCTDYITNAGEHDIQDIQKQINNKVQDNNNQENRKLYNSIIEIICEQAGLKDDSVNIKAIQCLQHLMTCSSCEIHGQAVLQVIRNIITIYSMNTKNQVLHNLSRNAVLQIIHVLYMRIEQVTILSEEEKQIFRNKKSSPNNWYGGNTPGNYNTNSPALPSSNNSLLQNDPSDMQQEQKLNKLQLANMASNQETSKLLYNYYVKKVITHCIDDLCLYEAKEQQIKQQALELFPDELEKQQEYIKEQIAIVPHRATPLTADTNKPQYKTQRLVEIENEQQIVSGKFGWCFICRNTAKNYCKDTRVPICSESCKIKHLEELNKLSKISEETQGYLQDGINVFKEICRISINDKQNLSSMQLKQKVIVLEILLSMLESAGPVFLSKKEFVNVIKTTLIQGLLQNCFSPEKSVFVPSFTIVVSLINNFRENLKPEILIFIQDIFINILESNNSNFNHRLFSLHVFHRIFKVPRSILELYVNYDCCLGEIGLVDNIVSILTKIGQGKYTKQEYSTLILPQQENQLKVVAIEALKELVKRLCDFLDQCELGQQEEDYSQLDAENEDAVRNSSSTISNNNEIANIMNNNNFDRIEQEKLKKQHILKAIQKFNLKCKSGLQHLIQAKIIDKDEPRQFAQILINYRQYISQEKIGEFIGNSADYNQQVLSEFIDLMDFSNQYIDEALRNLLTYFQLPGEAQQVDRIMQKFGEKFMNDNAHSTYIKSGDVAYVFSYSLMMLQTSLHNPQVQEKEKMTLAQFKSQIRGINEIDGKAEDIDPVEISRIYEAIKKQALAVHKDKKKDDDRNQALTLNEKQKKDLFLKESLKIVQVGKDKIKKQQPDNDQYTQVYSIGYLKSLMQEIWSPLFASFSRVYEESEDPGIIDTCLEGIVYCIKLLGASGMQTEQSTFIFLLTKHSGLLTPGQQIGEKNILCIKHILQCGLQAGNYLGESWKQILQCVSQLDYLHVLASKYKKDQIQGSQNKKTLKEQQLDQYNSDMIIQNIELSMIDKIFHSSHHLNPESIQIFIKCLCELSTIELQNIENPRIFCMQRISEVTGFNMQRVKYNWKEIWSYLSKFFQDAGTHMNPQIAELAVDFLKQLSLKFLQQKELKHFTFQKDFLAPFEQIYVNMKINNIQLKELIISCIYMLTNQSFYNLKSGWVIILRVVNLAITDQQPNLQQVSFIIIQKIMMEKLEAVLDVMVELVQALTKLAKGYQEKYAIQSISHLKTCLDFLIFNSNFSEKKTQLLENQKNVLSKQELQQITQLQIDSQKNLQSLWIPILSSLAILFDKDVPGVQKTSMETLFAIIKENGEYFTQEFWKQVIRSVLKHLFDEIQVCFSKKQYNNNEQYMITLKSATTAFERLQEVVIQFFNQLQPFWKEICDIILNSLQNQPESLVNLATKFLIRILENVGKDLSQQEWQIVINLFESLQVNQIFDTEMLLKQHPDLESPYLSIVNNIPTTNKIIFNGLNIQKCRRLSITQLMIIQTKQKVLQLFSDYLTNSQLQKLKEIAEKEYESSHLFNEKLYLRYCLWKNGLMVDLKSVPGLFKHEKESSATIIDINYEQYIRENTEQNLQLFLSQIKTYLQKFSSLVKEFTEKSQQSNTMLIQNSKKQVQQQENEKNDTYQKQQQQQELTDQQQYHYQKNNKQQRFNQQSQHSIEDLIQMYMLEFERKISGIKQVIHMNILPKLLDISPSTINPTELQQLVPILIDISSYSFTKSLSSLTCAHCEQCEQCSYYTPYQYDAMLKQLLNNYFTYTFSFVTQQQQQNNNDNMTKLQSKNSSYELVKEQTEEKQQLIQENDLTNIQRSSDQLKDPNEKQIEQNNEDQTEQQNIEQQDDKKIKQNDDDQNIEIIKTPTDQIENEQNQEQLQEKEEQNINNQQKQEEQSNNEEAVETIKEEQQENQKNEQETDNQKNQEEEEKQQNKNNDTQQEDLEQDKDDNQEKVEEKQE